MASAPDGASLQARLASIISDLDLVRDLSPAASAGLLSGARALALLVSSKCAFGHSLFRHLQSSEELRLITDQLSDDDALALALTCSPMRDVIYMRLKQPNGQRRKLCRVGIFSYAPK